jgi:Asp-tRNA(Asn)/Glu-tRNA(Gln) amidotransferase A subunit family amidase
VAIRRGLSGRPLPSAGGSVPYSRFLGTYLSPTAAAGTPALVVPAGFGDDSLPVGVQVHGPRFADRWLVEVAGPHLAAAGVAVAPPPGMP